MTKAQQLGITEFPYKEYDSNGNLIYRENSNGYWEKNEYDSNNNEIYLEDSYGHWYKYDYDSNGNKIYCESYYGNGWFRYYEGDKCIKQITEGCKEHYISYKRNIKLNNLLND